MLASVCVAFPVYIAISILPSAQVSHSTPAGYHKDWSKISLILAGRGFARSKRLNFQSSSGSIFGSGHFIKKKMEVSAWSNKEGWVFYPYKLYTNGKKWLKHSSLDFLYSRNFLEKYKVFWHTVKGIHLFWYLMFWSYTKIKLSRSWFNQLYFSLSGAILHKYMPFGILEKESIY